MKATIKLLLMMAFIIGISAPIYSQNTEQIYQKGLMKEEGEGSLNEAIVLYKQILENKDAAKSLQAKALLHIGMCYEKMGKQEATSAYQNLVNNYPGQKNEVAIAKERLSKLIVLAEEISKAPLVPKVMTNKKIWEANEVDNSGKISPDGKYISYVDWPAGDLAIYEIATEKKRRLTSYNYGENWSTDPKTTFVLSSIWSSNSRQNIYSTGKGEIRTIGLEDSTPLTIRKKETKNEWVVQVYDISRDGKTILGTIETMDRKTQIILVSVRDGEKQIIKELPGIRLVGNLKFTNDGTGIVYDYPSDLDSPIHDIYWLSLDGKTESPIIKHPAHDFVLDLSPDGNQLLFASTRSGKMGFYSVGLKNGRSQGNPIFIKTSEYPNLTGLGFSDNGVFYSFYRPFVTDVYETEINSETGTIISHPSEIIGSFMGENSAPDYSSDGKYLAFISRRPPFFTRNNGIPTGNVLSIKNLENGTLRELKPDIEDFRTLKWSPDNSSILMMNTNKERTTEIYRINIQTEELSLIFSNINRKIFDFEWSSDGKSIFMVHQYRENDTTKHKLVRFNLETKEEKILFVNHGQKGYFPDLATISCSPDGKWIAFLGLDQKKTLKIIPTSGGEVREIYSLDQKKTIDGKQIWSSKSYANLFIHHCWSADGKYIYLQKYREPRGDGIWNFWQIPVNGDTPVNLGLEMTEIWQINAHPNGRNLVYSNQGSSYYLPQIWMMENFLPDENKETELIPKTITSQKIWSGTNTDISGTPSPDGEFLSFMDKTGNLAIRNISTTESQLLTKEATWEKPMQFTIGSKVSPDGKQIAYSWSNSNGNYEVRLTNVKNPQFRILYGNEDEDVYPLQWSANGKIIYAGSFNYKTNHGKFLAITISNGDIQVLKTVDVPYWTQLSASPDNQFIVFDVPKEKDNGNFDIHIMSTKSKIETSLIEHPANDRLLGWFPNKNQILFKSDRSGTWDVWTVSVSKGKLRGEPKRILTDFGQVSPMGITNNGTFYYSFLSRKFTALSSPLDIVNAKLELESGKPMLGSIMYAELSPDGKSIAYTKEVQGTAGPGLEYYRPLFIMDLESGKEILLLDWDETRYAKWSPDGKTISITGYDKGRELEKDYRGGIYTIEVESAKVTEILAFSKLEEKEAGVTRSISEWSKDQKSIYYNTINQLIKRELKSGKEEILFQNKMISNRTLDLSPDGEWLLFSCENHINITPSHGGETKTLYSLEEDRKIEIATWSPDGEYVFFVERLKNKYALWRISSEGKNPIEVCQLKGPIPSISIHPNGNEMIITAFNQEMEIWSITNLLLDE